MKKDFNIPTYPLETVKELVKGGAWKSYSARYSQGLVGRLCSRGYASNYSSSHFGRLR